MILFHPANSVALGVATGYFDEPRNLSSFDRSGSTDQNLGGGGLGNWTSTTTITNSISEAVGVPNSLISSVGRVTGGIMSVRVTGSPSATGYMVSSCPMAHEVANHIDLYDNHAVSVRLKRHDLCEGVQDVAFHAPLLSPALMETYTPTNPAFHWSEMDPFGGVVLTFHELNYNSTLGMPFIVEVDMQVGIQSRLEVEDRHFATNHTHEKVDLKKDLHSAKNMGVIGSSRGELSKQVQSSSMIRDTAGIK
jgi:hypothetical protein